MSTAILLLRAQALRVASRRAATRSSLAVAVPARTLTTPPDPTKPSSNPSFDSASPPKGTSNTFWFLLLGTGAAVGGWYYMNMEDGEDAHAARKRHEEELKRKSQEALEAGRQTAHGAVREGQQGYEDAKASGKAKLDQARAQASRAESSLSSYKTSAGQTISDASHRAEQTYHDAKHKAGETYSEAKHTVDETAQSWGSWVGSWFGYGQNKVAEGARKVEKEAEKRT